MAFDMHANSERDASTLSDMSFATHINADTASTAFAGSMSNSMTAAANLNPEIYATSEADTLNDIASIANVNSKIDVTSVANIFNDEIFDTHSNFEISVTFDASVSSDSSLDTSDSSTGVNSSNNMTMNAIELNEHTYSMTDNILSIKMIRINVCGLLSKLRYPDFTELCQSYDIVCLVVSKLGFLESFEIQNFEILHLLNRKKS